MRAPSIRSRCELPPDEFGAQFGPTTEEIATVSAWLRSKGFPVNAVAAGRRSIEFSGNAGLVEQAFHTQMHRFILGGTLHIANASEISIPADFAAVVAGVASLNDFHSAPQHHVATTTPGIVSSGELTEALLDVEWAGRGGQRRNHQVRGFSEYVFSGRRRLIGAVHRE